MMEYEKRQAMKATAKRVADQLFADAKAGKLQKVGIDEIRRALRAEPSCPTNRRDYDTLEEMTTRSIVELVG